MTDNNFFDTNNSFNDYYKILDVDPSADIKEIKKSYIKLVKIHHPDHGGDERMYHLISRAMDVLTNKESRKNYDLEYHARQNEDNNETLDYFRKGFNEFINTNTVNKTREEINMLYHNEFLEKQIPIEKRLDNLELNERISNLSTVRNQDDIENNDDTVKKILEAYKDDPNPPSFNEIFEFVKLKEEKNALVNKTPMSFDLMPNYGVSASFSMFNSNSVNGNNSMFSEPKANKINFDENKKKNFDIQEFRTWRNQQKKYEKLTNKDIEDYIKRRDEETKQLIQETNNNLKDFKKKTELKEFLKLTNDINIDDFKQPEENKINLDDYNLTI